MQFLTYTSWYHSQTICRNWDFSPKNYRSLAVCNSKLPILAITLNFKLPNTSNYLATSTPNTSNYLKLHSKPLWYLINFKNYARPTSYSFQACWLRGNCIEYIIFTQLYKRHHCIHLLRVHKLYHSSNRKYLGRKYIHTSRNIISYLYHALALQQSVSQSATEGALVQCQSLEVRIDTLRWETGFGMLHKLRMLKLLTISFSVHVVFW